jgi:hypothetical protein
VFNAYPVASLPLVRDLTVIAVIDPHTLDLAEQVLSYVNLPSNFSWTLRMNSLTLSGIPGGILFPNTPYGTIVMPSGEIHIGGCTDVYVAGSSFDVEVLTLNDIVDDDPVLEGVDLNANIASVYPNTSYVQLLDYILAPGTGENYSVGDATYTALQNAEANGLSIQILDPPNAGAYRILSVTQAAGVSPILLITPPIQQVTGAYRWRISDDIFIDLLNPKQTKVSGSDMSTVLGQNIVTTASGVDFADYGVAEGDILQLLNGGLVMASYTVQSVAPPFYNELIVDRPLAASVSDVSYIVYTPNTDGGMIMPFVRINEIELLDTSGQPVGTTIPYAKPVDCETNGFASIGSGIKADVADGVLGLVSVPFAEFGVTKGSADITAPGLYGITGTLASTTLILNVNGAGNVTLDLSGSTNAANEEALLSAIQSTWPALSVIVLGVNLVLYASGGIDVGAGTANVPLGLTAGPGTVPTPALDLNGLTLTIALATGVPLVTITFTTNLLTPDGVAAQINAAVAAVTTPSIVRTAVSLGADINNNANRIGILPIFPGLMVTGGTALLQLFGYATGTFTTRDVTSITVYTEGGWASLRPALDASYDVAQALDGTQLGFFQLSASVVGDTFDPVPNTPFNNTAFDPLRTLYDFNPEIGRHIQVGARSLGTVVLYFIDPTSFEVNGNTFFTFTGTDGSVLNYFPDPTQKYQTIPAQPSGAKPLDGTTGIGADLFQSLSTNFVTQGVQYGDELVIDFTPITGTVDLTDPVSNLNTKTLTLSLGGGPDKIIIFINDSGAIAPTDVTRAGVVTQINNVVGLNICSLNGLNQLVFNPTSSLIIRGAMGVMTVGPGPANLILGFSNVVGIDQNNDAEDEGTYTITGIAPGGNVNVLQVDRNFPSNPSGTSAEQFSIFRPGIQRIVSTTMANNVADGGLYSFQLQLVSQGTGSQYNIGAGIQLTVDGYISDGYYLTTDDPNLSFSPVERPKLIISTSILAPGVSDNPSNATFLAGQNLQVSYDQSPTVQDTNNFITADTERVICASPLARHLIPYFVRLTLVYFGGSTADLVTSDIEAFIAAIVPNGQLHVSDIENICANRNATSVQNPIDLIAIIHNIDRSLSTERSQNYLNTGRLAAFFSDVLQVSRNITGSGN